MVFNDLFSFEAIRDYLKARNIEPFLGETLFPEVKVQDMDIAYIKGANNLPVIASVHSLDTETETAARDDVEMVKARLALIKRKIRMSEELIIKLKSPRNSAELEHAKQMFFNDAEQMYMAVKTRIEKMRMDVLVNGVIDRTNTNAQVVSVSYGFPPEHLNSLAGSSVWSDPASDPLNDIITWSERLSENSGVVATRAITSSKVMYTLLSHPKLKQNIVGSSGAFLTKNKLNEFMQSNGLPVIVTYDKKFRREDQSGDYKTERFFPEDRFVMFGDGILGETVYGLTPEEIELQDKGDITENNNVIVQVYNTQDPVSTWTKAVAMALPTFPAAGEVISSAVLG